MDGARAAAALRALRRRSGWTQAELARRAGVGRRTVAKLESGRIATMSLAMIEVVAGTLGLRLHLVPRWRGGELDRLLDHAHARLVEAVVRLLRATGWEVVAEATFSVYGERGSIDVLAWHPRTGILLVVEVKSSIHDIQALLAGIDRKRRLASRLATERGWNVSWVACWLAVGEGRTNRRRIAAHRATLATMFDSDGRGLRSWLTAPTPRLGFVSFLPKVRPGVRRSAISA
jgi:transcriptional regulator with XRE-family HTH domain